MSHSSAAIDLAALKHELQGAYDAYDRAVAAGSKTECLKARNRIMDDIRPAIAAAISAPQGIYLFADLAQTSFDSIIYIGCAHTSDLGKRLGDYLIRDISGLDMQLATLAEGDARAKIDKRIAVTMPTTAQLTRAKYVEGHLRTMRLTRGGMLFVTSMSDAELVTAVEGMLICTAWGLGARLENRECRWPAADIRRRARDRAKTILSGWAKQGLSQSTVSAWSAGLDRLAVD
jgi:hypothetical protein